MSSGGGGLYSECIFVSTGKLLNSNSYLTVNRHLLELLRERSLCAVAVRVIRNVRIQGAVEK